MLGKRDSRSLAGAMVSLSAQRRLMRLRTLSVINTRLCQLTPDPLVSDPCVHCSVVSVRMCVGHLQPIRGQLCVSVDESEARVRTDVVHGTEEIELETNHVHRSPYYPWH